MNEFSINGRFLAQNPTGVQRHALEITLAIDALLEREFSHLSGNLIVPMGVSIPNFKKLNVIQTNYKGSVIWEQVNLPMSAEGMLLCFGNTGPIIYREKIVCIHDSIF